MALSNQTKTTPRHLLVAFVFLIIVLLLTVGTYAYKLKVASDNSTIVSDIQDIKKVISKMREDEDIQTYELYSNNKRQLDDLAYFSDIPTFYREAKKLSKANDIKLGKFSYAKGKLNMSATALSESSEEAYEKFDTFIEKFRQEEITESDIFRLNFIPSFQGYNNISAGINFEIQKPVEKKEVNDKISEAISGGTLKISGEASEATSGNQGQN